MLVRRSSRGSNSGSRCCASEGPFQGKCQVLLSKPARSVQPAEVATSCNRAGLGWMEVWGWRYTVGFNVDALPLARPQSAEPPWRRLGRLGGYRGGDRRRLANRARRTSPCGTVQGSQRRARTKVTDVTHTHTHTQPFSLFTFFLCAYIHII